MKRSASICGLVAALAMGVAAAEETAQSPEGLFKSLDKNGDGRLAADEVPDAQARFFERLVRIGDKNSDGQLSREEFAAGLTAADRPVANPEMNRPGDGQGAQQFLEMLKRLDANGDGKVSKSEVPEGARERLQPVFDRAGTDEIDLKQMAARMQQFQRPGAGGDVPRLPILVALDADGDRRISADEFAKAAEKFRDLDRNGDGFLDAQEIMGGPIGFARPEMPADGQPRRPGQPNARPLDAPNLEQLLTRLDKDGDGALSESEAPERMKERFSEIDKDSDGKLSKDELRNAPRPQFRDRPRRPE
jgi:Ca2+-binding EF-hand superfamily protein